MDVELVRAIETYIGGTHTDYVQPNACDVIEVALASALDQCDDIATPNAYDILMQLADVFTRLTGRTIDPAGER